MGGRCFKIYFFISHDPSLIWFVINSTNFPKLSVFCPLVSDFSLSFFWPIGFLFYFSPMSSWGEKWQSSFCGHLLSSQGQPTTGALFQLSVSGNLTKAENLFCCCCYSCCTERKLWQVWDHNKNWAVTENWTRCIQSFNCFMFLLPGNSSTCCPQPELLFAAVTESSFITRANLSTFRIFF